MGLAVIYATMDFISSQLDPLVLLALLFVLFAIIILLSVCLNALPVFLDCMSLTRILPPTADSYVEISLL